MKFGEEIISVLEVSEDEGIENDYLSSVRWDLLSDYNNTRHMELTYDCDELAFVSVMVLE